MQFLRQSLVGFNFDGNAAIALVILHIFQVLVEDFGKVIALAQHYILIPPDGLK